MALFYIIFHFSSPFFKATDDFTALNDSFTLSEDTQIQCVPIPITSDSVDEPGLECFFFTISNASGVDGLTLCPSQAEICVSDSKYIHEYNLGP